MELKVCMIGMSEGNGHPFSWSAILNGYNSKMAIRCPYPVILDYLSKQSWPADVINGMSVTGIHCNDVHDAKSVSEFANIVTVFDKLNTIPLNFSGVIIARDDAENHFHYAQKFLSNNIKVMLDKPIATSKEDLLKLEPYIDLVFSHTSCIYSNAWEEFISFFQANSDKITTVLFEAPKDWKRYGIHVLEPFLILLRRFRTRISTVKPTLDNDGIMRGIDCQAGSINFQIFTTNKTTPAVKFSAILMDSSHHEFVVNDVFMSFKLLLEDYKNFLINEPLRYPIDKCYYSELVEFLSMVKQ